MTFFIGVIIAVIAGGLGYFGGSNVGYEQGLIDGKLAGRGATTPASATRLLKVSPARAKKAPKRARKTVKKGRRA